jgi:hypothetical protein
MVSCLRWMTSQAGVLVDQLISRQLVSLIPFLFFLGAMGCDDGTKSQILADAGQPDQMMLTAPDMEDAATPFDAGTVIDSGPEEFVVGEALPSNTSTVVDGWLARWSVLFDGRIVGQTNQGISLFDSGSEQALGTDLGELIVARTAGTEILVLTDQGLFVLGPDGLELSPVDELVNGISGLTEDPDGGVWIMSSAHLSRWYDGQLRSVDLPQVDIEYDAARYAVGHYQGQSVLWLASGPILTAVSTEEAWRFDWPQDIDWMTTTQQGIWIATGEELHLIDERGDARVWSRPLLSRIGVGSLHSRQLWISSGLALQQWNGERLTARTDVPDHVGLQVDGSGTAYLANLAGIHRVVPGRFIDLTGLEPNERLVRTTEVTIVPSSPDQITEITTQVDMEQVISIAEGPWRVTLDPVTIGPGEHTLTVEIRYDDGITISQALNFVGPPTWTANIHAVYESQCSACHGNGGSAHPMADYTAWKNEILAIIDDIETGRMPYGLPRLSADQIQLVRDWQASGFLEQ